MGEISVSEGRVCIVKISDASSTKSDLEKIKNALIDFTTSTEVQNSDLDAYVFVDLSPFNVINSSLVGILGSMIMDPKIQLLALCGLRPSVKDILKRFSVIADDSGSRKFASEEIQNNISKVFTFNSIEEGLVCLNPA